MHTQIKWAGVTGLLCLFQMNCASALGESWQNIVQPIGNLQISPPESGMQVNQYLMSLDPNITQATLPFDPGTQVTKITTTQPQYFVRTYNPASGSGPVGSWVMRSSEARGLSPEQIRNRQALPALPTMFTMVLVPAGITIYTGIAGPIAGWGDGGATQEKLIGPPYVPKENFFNRQEIGNCFLCYRVLASEGNANRVGAALDRHIPRAYSPLESIYTNLDLLYFGQTATQFRAALNALSGEGATGSQSVSFANTTSFMEVIRQQSSTWLTDTKAVSTSSQDNQTSAFANGAWAHATGSSSYLKGNNGAASLNANAAGLQAGIGRQLTPDVMIGAALGVSDARYSVSDLATQASLLSLNLGLYGIAKKDDVYASGALTYSRGDTTMHRSISINELFNQQKSSFNTEVYSARLELGYRAKLPALNLTPFIAFQPAWLRQNTFDESAYGSGNSLVNMGLNYQSQTVTSLPGSIGLQLDRKTTLDNGWTLNPTLRVSWIHEFQPDRNITAALNLLPSQTFTIYGASAPGNTVQAIAGLTASDGNNISGYLMLGADMSDRGQSIQGRIGLNILF